MNKIICGDCLEVLPTLPWARTIFADPPDNLGQKYGGFADKRKDYIPWLKQTIEVALTHNPDIFWISIYYRHLCELLGQPLLRAWSYAYPTRLFVWRYTFGQHQKTDCGNGYRPILRFSKPGVKWNTDAIRVPSARQIKYKDKRANPDGRVPDDVWEFPRVCGTFKERRKDCPNQHPEALMERIVKMSGGPVIDMFGGSFTTQIVCDRLGIPCTSIEIRQSACGLFRRINNET
jgi:site-specific DNA-methyltransferase (adenine-specific)